MLAGLRPVGKLAFKIKFHGAAACSIWNQSQFPQPCSTSSILKSNLGQHHVENATKDQAEVGPVPTRLDPHPRGTFPTLGAVAGGRPQGIGGSRAGIPGRKEVRRLWRPGDQRRNESPYSWIGGNIMPRITHHA